jgi:hypothetical protein
MLKIKNGKVEKIVTKGAYENMYKAMGFEIVGDKKINKEVKEVKEVKEAKVVEPIVEEKVEEPMFDKKELEDFILNELKEQKPKSKKGLK